MSQIQGKQRRAAAVAKKPVKSSVKKILTMAERQEKIVTLFDARFSPIKIAGELDIPYSTVKRVVANYKKTGSIVRKRGSGCRSLLSEKDLSIIKATVEESGKVSAPKIAGQLTAKTGTTVSAGTIRNALRKLDYTCHVVAVKPLLTADHKKRRLDLATEWSRWPFTKLKRIIFSDESRFLVSGSDGRTLCYRKVGERLNEKNCSHSIKGSGAGVMVWGCIGYEGVGALAVVNGNLDSVGYTRLLSTHLHESAVLLGLGDDFTFQQDNASCHTSRYTMEFFEDNKVTLLDWPAQSPDMNPIEHVWSYIASKLAQIKINNRAHLIREIFQIWGDIPKSYVQRLYYSLPKRFEAVIRTEGSHTKY